MKPFALIWHACLLFGLMLPMTQGQNPGVGEWERKADMQIPRHELSPSSGVVDGQIYVFGGSNGPPAWKTHAPVEVYDPATDTWEVRTEIPTPRAGLATSVIDGRFYTVGGYSGWVTVEVYDPVTDTWERKADMPTRRSHFSTSVVEGILYAIGGALGCLEGCRGYSTVEAYDPVTDTWEKKADMPTARMGLSTSVVDGIIYAIGGSNENIPLAAVEAYDPATDTWTKKQDMQGTRAATSTCVVDGRIYTIGGYTGNFLPLASVEIYDPGLDRWQRPRKGEMDFSRGWLSTSVVDGRIYAIGGFSAGPMAVVEVCDTGVRTPESVQPHNKLATVWGRMKHAP